ncbi:N-acetylneuraminate synthase family protein [Pelagibacteraceae bacterium]|nr:N-acetylneuraminate synthase family protein [Pelagibacteraceae bacterium]
MKPSIKFKIGNKTISQHNPAYIIAEIGSNHNNNLQIAKKLIKEAANCGVDAVKFQTFKAENHYSKYSPGFNYLKNKSTFELIKSLEIDRNWQPILKKYSENLGLDFFSSPCDIEAVDQLKDLKVVANKVASFDLTDLDLIRYIASTKKPIILSTGMATMREIDNAINCCLKENNSKIIVLQCTSLYPAPTKLSNVNAIKSINTKFGVITGYSDHTTNNLSCLAAISVGAKVIEKHFTLNKKMKGPDHPFAIEPNQLKKLVLEIRNIEQILGNGKKNGPSIQEKEMYLKGRRSVHAKVDIKKNEIIKDYMLINKRPGLGLHPSKKYKILGKKAKKNIKKDQWIIMDMIN